MKKVTKSNEPYTAFSDLLGKLAKVPHSEIKAKLEAEKKAKETNKAKK